VSGGALKRAKRRIRREVLAARDALPPEQRTAMGTLIAGRFLALPEVEAAATVLLFWSFGSEPPTASLIERLHAREVRVALPRTEGANLVAARYGPGDPTGPTSFGAMEPVDGIPVAPADLEVVAVPGVAFDRRGRRIGYGGGFYDRFLPRTRAVAIGLAFGIQVVEGDLPAGGADIGVDLIVTEAETIRVGSTGDLNSRSAS
jgi:5-formyltetrahydrofolate cyclo-ligase